MSNSCSLPKLPAKLALPEHLYNAKCITYTLEHHQPRGHFMATNKPRITITLEPHVYEVLTRLAELQGGSKAGIISDLLESVSPVFERTCYVLQMANSATTGLNADIRASMERSEAKIQAMMDDAVGQLDIFAMHLTRAAQDGSGVVDGDRAAGAMDGDGDEPLPPHSNTGVTPTPHRKTPTKSTPPSKGGKTRGNTKTKQKNTKAKPRNGGF